MCIKIVEW